MAHVWARAKEARGECERARAKAHARCTLECKRAGMFALGTRGGRSLPLPGQAGARRGGIPWASFGTQFSTLEAARRHINSFRRGRLM
eukprot:6097001-Alexandrium_andersonii.AAC.1